MCGCTLKLIPASSPARASSLANPDGVNGPPRSEAKTKGEADWRLQLPQRPQFIAEKGVCCFPAALGATHIDVPVSNSIDDHCRSQSSDTRRP